MKLSMVMVGGEEGERGLKEIEMLAQIFSKYQSILFYILVAYCTRNNYDD